MGGDQGWIILRTAGRATLRLADELSRDGIEAWTPRVLPEPKEPKESDRRPRSRSRRRQAEVNRELVPALATFVFAPERYLGDLIDLAERGQFSIMTDKMRGRGYVIVADRALDPLRALEASAEASAAEMRRAAMPVEPFSNGEAVKVPYDPRLRAFEGASGIVESSDGKKTWINFGGVMGRVEIETFRLRPLEKAA